MIQVAITDDHPSIIEGLKTMLEKDKNISVSCICSSGKETIKNLPGKDVDVLLLDINLPDISGIEVCKTIMQEKPKLGIIAFTSFKNTAYLKDILKAGGKGFMLKNSSYDEIFDAIVKVAAGIEYIQPEMKELLIEESLSRTTNVSFIPKLTRREKEILTLILDEFTTNEIADKLFLSSKTVETHRLNLLQKLGAKNTAGLVKTALQFNLV